MLCRRVPLFVRFAFMLKACADALRLRRLSGYEKPSMLGWLCGEIYQLRCGFIMMLILLERPSLQMLLGCMMLHLQKEDAS